MKEVRVMDNKSSKWFKQTFGTDIDKFINSLKMSPGSQGGIHGAISEYTLKETLEAEGFETWRIKEKPIGGYDEKKEGYKGDFIIKDKSGKHYTVECKGLKTNSEFRFGETDAPHSHTLTKQQVISTLNKFIGIDSNKKEKIYNKGLETYNKAKQTWETNNPGKTFPEFSWKKDYPGCDSANLSQWFANKTEIEEFVESIHQTNKDAFTEEAFRNKQGIYKILQTQQQNKQNNR